MRSSCRAGLHRDPLSAPAAPFLQAKRVSGMHLKPYLKLQKKERSPELSQDSLRSPPMSHQRATQEEKYTNNCTKLSPFPKPSLVPPSRKLLGIIYPNTMCNMNGKAPADAPSAREKKGGLSATIHQGEEGEGPLDVWAVVKPGNTKEKIAFFAAQQCSGGGRFGSMKIKSTWDIDGRAAKRRKKSVDLKKARLQLERVREASARCAPPEPFACFPAPSCLKRQVSHDLLETRFKIQQLLEPQQYMAFLPHHIIVKIFGLLPTRSLVALKCTCYYFKFLIEYYNIRPADSRWVRDPRYREDPCKQCKKKYVKGDVSLCRWHPKPYCQALPYGPGYWMCCHRSQKGIPGCKLGLHDNHWVPACHSFNRALHKKARGAGGDAEDEY
ncbi:PREDICTED: F-box only protein 34-like [Tinamus guttatus]|uniref:F-box only protein 34-like n=1 Tax=Tinamus guttatus TaxID=94827 RepID=UPI00052E6BA3|nr:PREDICTED: F-box only protein 34-like [Tinamus guttatus]